MRGPPEGPLPGGHGGPPAWGAWGSHARRGGAACAPAYWRAEPSEAALWPGAISWHPVAVRASRLLPPCPACPLAASSPQPPARRDSPAVATRRSQGRRPSPHATAITGIQSFISLSRSPRLRAMRLAWPSGLRCHPSWRRTPASAGARVRKISSGGFMHVLVHIKRHHAHLGSPGKLQGVPSTPHRLESGAGHWCS